MTTKTLAKGLLIFVFGVIIIRFFNFLFKVFFSRFYGVADFGLFILGFTIFTFLATLAFSGMEYTTSRFVAYYHAKKNYITIIKIFSSIFYISFGISIILAVSLFFLALPISSFLQKPELSSLLQRLSFGLPIFVLLSLLQKIMEGFKNVVYSVIVDLCTNFLKLFSLFIAFFLGYTVKEFAILFVVSLVLVLIIAVLLTQKMITFDFKNFLRSYNPKVIKELYSYAWPIIISIIFANILTYTDVLMLGYFSAYYAVGVYSAIFSLASLLMISLMASNVVLLPIMTSYFTQKKFKEMKETYTRIIKWIVTFGIPPLFLFLFFSKPLIVFIFGKEFISGVFILPLLAIGMFFSAAISPANSILFATSKTKYYMFNTITSTFINIGLNIWLIPIFGIVGAAMAFFITSLLLNTLRILEVHTFYNIYPLTLSILKIFLAGIFSSVITLLLRIQFNAPLATLVFSEFLFFLFYCVLYFFFKCYDKEDLIILKSVKDKIKQLLAP